MYYHLHKYIILINPLSEIEEQKSLKILWSIVDGIVISIRTLSRIFVYSEALWEITFCFGYTKWQSRTLIVP